MLMSPTLPPVTPAQPPAPPAPRPAPPPARRPGARRTSLTLLALIFAGFISLGLPDGLLGVAWPSMRRTFGVPLDALGPLLATTILGYLASSLVSGWAVERLGVGRLLALSAFATAAGLLGYALAPTWGLVVLLGLVAGLGAGAIDAGLNAYVALAHSSRLLNWLHACFGLGAATGPAIMMAVLDAGQPWRLGYGIVAGGQTVLGVCFLLTRRQWRMQPVETPARPPAPDGAEGSVLPSEARAADAVPAPPVGSPAPAAAGGHGRAAPADGRVAADVRAVPLSLDDRAAAVGPARRLTGPRHWPAPVWLSVALFLLYTGVETAAGQWAYTLFVEGRAMAPHVAGAAVSAYWGALAAGRVLAGLVAHRPTPAMLVRGGALAFLAGAVLVWLDLGQVLSFAGLGLMGLAAAPIFPTLIAVTPSRFGADRAAAIIGVQVAAASLGIAGLPALAGALAARVGLEVIPALLVLASVGLVLLHEVVVRAADGPGRAADYTRPA